MKTPRMARLFGVSLLTAVFVAVATLPVLAGSIEGSWTGAVQLPSGQLNCSTHFKQDGGDWNGTIDIPQQGAKGLPLSDISVDGNSVSFKIGGIPGDPTFSGTLSAEGTAIEGDFSQGGQTFPFKLEATDQTEPSSETESSDAPSPAPMADLEPIEGHWKGAIEVPGNKIEYTTHFKNDGGTWSATIDIPSQGGKDIPLVEVAVQGTAVRFKISGVPGDPSFAGELSDDGKTIKGDFTQGGQTMPFEMKSTSDPAEDARGALQGFETEVEKMLEEWKGVGVAVGAIVGDDPVLLKGFGHRDREGGLPVTENTLFAIGSATKAFTCFALATLVDEGKLEWDKPVVNYLPGLQLYDQSATQRITARDLVTHRSGLPRHDLVWYNNQSISRSDLMQRVRYLQPSKDLREVFQYNNNMYAMAGYLLGQLTESTWEEAVRKRILEPLGMRNTNFSVHDSQNAPDFALPYQVHDEEIEKMSFRDIEVMGPAGSINSSVADMTRWLQVFLKRGEFGGERLLQENTIKDLISPQMAVARLPTEDLILPAGYGMGWGLSSYQGKYRVAHGGNIDGFSALVTFFPYDDLGIVVLANQNGSALPGLITNHLADRVLGVKGKNWHAEAFDRYQKGLEVEKEAEKKKETVRVPDTRTAHPIEAYAGEYHHPGYGTLSIEHADGKLSMVYNGIRTPLEHWHYDTFNGLENPDDRTFEDFRIQFATNLKGQIDNLSGPFEPSVDPIVFKRKGEARLSDPVYLARFEGTYELGPQQAKVALRGETLTVTLPGQPTYDLEPDRDDEFNLKGVSVVSVKFEIDEDGTMSIAFRQPNGVYSGKRIEEK